MQHGRVIEGEEDEDDEPQENVTPAAAPEEVSSSPEPPVAEEATAAEAPSQQWAQDRAKTVTPTVEHQRMYISSLAMMLRKRPPPAAWWRGPQARTPFAPIDFSSLEATGVAEVASNTVCLNSHPEIAQRQRICVEAAIDLKRAVTKEFGKVMQSNVTKIAHSVDSNLMMVNQCSACLMWASDVGTVLSEAVKELQHEPSSSFFFKPLIRSPPHASDKASH